MKHRREISRTRRIRSLEGSGFSIVEVLVGFLILLMVLVGLLPLFTRAVAQNVAGKDSMNVTNHGGGRLENRIQLTFNNWDLEIDAGSTRQNIDWWSLGNIAEDGDEEWVADPTGLTATWQRTTTVRQFSINGVNDTDLDGRIDEVVGIEDTDHDGYFDAPLASGTNRNAIHLKEVRVQMISQRNPFGGGAPIQMTLRSLKAF